MVKLGKTLDKRKLFGLEPNNRGWQFVCGECLEKRRNRR